MIIIGAGLSGLLAATQFQTAQVYESDSPERVGHKALLRFRSSSVGDAVGIEFRKVRVHKGIWSGGKFTAPNIRLANLYSQKVLSRLGDRSIWNLDPVDRFIAPDSLMEQLIERVGARIHWSSPLKISEDVKTHGAALVIDKPTSIVHTTMGRYPIISTMPMSVLVKQLELKKHPEFAYSPIFVTRYKIHNADVFQTVYFPDEDTPVYRASMTGNTLIIESMRSPGPLDIVFQAFGIQDSASWMTASEESEQRYGKIAPIEDGWRRNFIAESTRRLNVYALGRFAVWRNILADDVLKDIAVIKRLLKGDAYGQSLTASGSQ